MGKCILALLFVIFFSLDNNMFGQITFFRIYDGKGSNRAYCIQHTSDEGYILTGYANNYTNPLSSKFILMKINKHGDSLWTKTYGPNKHQIGEYVMQCSDGGYFAVGYTTNDSNFSQNTYLVKTAPDGTLLWEKTLKGNLWNSFGRSALCKSDGSIYLPCSIGEPGSDLMKLDKDGNVKWTKSFPEIFYNQADKIVESGDNGFVLSGSRPFLLKTDSLGNMLWYKYLMVPDSTIPGGGVDITALAGTDDNGYLLAGYKTVHYMTHYKYFMIVIKTDSQGDTLWTKTYNYKDGEIMAIDKTPDGGFILSVSYDVGKCLIKIDSSGNILWEKSIADFNSWFYSVKYTSDGGFIAAGTTNNWHVLNADVNISVLKTDSRGNVTYINDKTSDFKSPGRFTLFQNYPNPFNPSTKFTFSIPKDGYTELKIYNSLGQEVKTLVSEVLSEGEYSFEWNANSFSSGIYYYTLKCGESVTSNKMILVK